MVSCSRCQGTGWDETIGSKCPDCNGAGKFTHWNEDQDPVKLLEDLEWSKVWLESTKQTLMDYVSGGQYQDDIIDRRLKLERMRWERDYWAFRVQTLQGELELMKGAGGGQSVESDHHGTSCGEGPPDGTGPGPGSLHEGRVDDRDGRTEVHLGFRIP
jgi:hypothetical protein